MAESVNLDDIYDRLIVLRTRIETAETRAEALEETLRERDKYLQQAAAQAVTGMGLKVRKNARLQEVLGEAIRIYNNTADEQAAAVEKYGTEIRDLRAQLRVLQATQQDVVNKITEALELKPNPHRTLDNAAAEALVLINEAKRIIRTTL
jgi:phage shock protein A